MNISWLKFLFLFLLISYTHAETNLIGIWQGVYENQKVKIPQDRFKECLMKNRTLTISTTNVIDEVKSFTCDLGNGKYSKFENWQKRLEIDSIIEKENYYLVHYSHCWLNCYEKYKKKDQNSIALENKNDVSIFTKIK